MLDAVAQGVRAAGLAVVVRGRPRLLAGAGLDGDRRVEHHGRGGVAVVERRRVDDRLERGAGLAHRLGGAVELGFLVGEAADHGVDAPRIGVHRDDGAGHLGLLAQAVGALGRIERLDVDHVAHLQRGGDRAAGPLHAFRGDRAGLALLREGAAGLALGLEADLGDAAIGVQHHGEPPGGDVAERRHLGDRLAPVAAGQVDLVLGAAPAAGLVVAHEAVDERLARQRLHLRVEGGAHREAALVELALAVALGDLAADLFREVVGVGRVREGDARVDAERLLLGLRRLLGGDVAVLGHQADDLVAARQRLLRPPVGVVVVRPLRQGREIGRLVDRQLVDGFSEVVERGRRHAVQVAAGDDGAEEDLVEVELEDLVLRVGRFDPQGDQRFLDLAVVGLLGGEQEVLGHLLGDGRGALLLAGLRVGQHRAHDALGVDAAVLVEVLVLGREEGRDHDLRHRLDRQVEAPLVGVLGEQRAVRGVDAGHHRRLVVGERGVVRQILAVLPVEERAHRGGDAEQHGAGREQEGEESQDETHPGSVPSLVRCAPMKA
ncbi:hypothetical protein CHKEEEPN_4978 [Methylorubrum podarium]|nr:hypothetical protein CHKEEEPN_4978 [Methylorubrum podarium]